MRNSTIFLTVAFLAAHQASAHCPKWDGHEDLVLSPNRHCCISPVMEGSETSCCWPDGVRPFSNYELGCSSVYFTSYIKWWQLSMCNMYKPKPGVCDNVPIFPRRPEGQIHRPKDSGPVRQWRRLESQLKELS